MPLTSTLIICTSHTHMCTHTHTHTHTYTHTHTNTDRHFFGIYVVDNSNTITCSISGATRFEWLLGGQTVVSTATLSLTVNDSIHHNLYICQGHNATSLLNGLHVVVIVNGMAASLTTIVTMSNLCEYG